MKRRIVLRVAGGLVIVVLAVLVGGWLAFVPWAKEPGYRFVAAWGEKGDGPGQFHEGGWMSVCSHIRTFKHGAALV